MSDKPLVSICCSTYNHEPYIAQTIQGFLIQKPTFSLEIIIHDDASTDKTTDIIREYFKKNSEIIKPIFQTENQYSKGNKPLTKYVFPKARGKYIALCEGDDYWTDPYKLQKQVDFLEGHPELTMCFTNSSIVDEHGNIIKVSRLNTDRKRNLSQADIISGLILSKLI